MRLEDLKKDCWVAGVEDKAPVCIVDASWCGSDVIEIVYRDADGKVGQRILYREDEPRLQMVRQGRVWSFQANGADLRLVTEAERINLAHHFDPFHAVHTSLIEPLPHQLTAVYDAMLPRQPLRFLLADDPGAGKTIMAGLLMKELMLRADLERCLVVAPGTLVEQWQDELHDKFGLEFFILTRDMVQASRTGNPFNEYPLLIARLDMLARNDDLKIKLQHAHDWDLIICDEAHRMSATWFGNEVKYTKRYRLGQLLGRKCRHFLLMTATPHNGKDADFQLFMALLDADRFEGRPRQKDGVRRVDVSDLMRRLTKEELLRFDGTPLFPERRAYTVKYHLSPAEAALYADVTDYVRNEMNRVQQLEAERGDGKKRNMVGFALQILQRRLASSPKAIYESLKRRRERLERELEEARILHRERQVRLQENLEFQAEDLLELEEFAPEEFEERESEIAATLTAAETIEELEKEIATLKRLESQALALLRSKEDSKWQQLSRILDDDLMRDAQGNHRKLIIFTEARDTLEYLAERIRTRLGRPEAVDVIHGGIGREERRKVVQRFMNDKELLIFIANDAAGEGVNLQRAHLMVNYDLPWNPNRIEQRFGRIHRIGQTEVCHLWNLVAADTREGAVYARLLDKLEQARKALGGKVFDVLGELFEERPLRDLLWQAVQYNAEQGIQPPQPVLDEIERQADAARIEAILKERKLTNDVLNMATVEDVRRQMELADARRLQPHHVQGFFLKAFEHLGGRVRRREPGRFEVLHVPSRIRERDRQIGSASAPVQRRYERICFDKAFINQQPVAEFITPRHPLMQATISLIREELGDVMKKGAVMVDETDDGQDISAIFFVDHAVEDGRRNRHGERLIISRRLHFIRINERGLVSDAGIAPHLDMRPARPEEVQAISDVLQADWLRDDLESTVRRFALNEMVRTHVEEVKQRRLPEIDKVEHEVKARLQREIRYWDARAAELREAEKAGKVMRLSAENAARKAEELAERLKRRLQELNLERDIRPAPPVIRGGMLVVPAGLLRQRLKQTSEMPATTVPEGFAEDPAARAEIEKLAMDAVMAKERELGFEPEDVSARKMGFDILSRDPKTGRLRFIEVKGRVEGAKTVMLTRNEIITSLNKEEDFILAIVFVSRGFACAPIYIHGPIRDHEPNFTEEAVQFNIQKLLMKHEIQ
jgi:superfamily II DNA or RNA helicase